MSHVTVGLLRKESQWCSCPSQIYLKNWSQVSQVSHQSQDTALSDRHINRCSSLLSCHQVTQVLLGTRATVAQGGQRQREGFKFHSDGCTKTVCDDLCTGLEPLYCLIILDSDPSSRLSSRTNIPRLEDQLSRHEKMIHDSLSVLGSL